MSGLSTAHRVALAALIEQSPDATLVKLSAAAVALPGARALELGAMLADEVQDRKRRRLVMAPLLPMFRQRADGIEAMTFPPAVLPRLWKAGSAREPALLPQLDEEGPDAVAVSDRICLAAAAAVRDRPETIWPADLEPERRERGLFDLAACLDLAHLARRGLPSIEVWLKRPDGDQVAELRLLIKDCAGIHIDGAQRVLEMLFSHLDDAVLILRIITQSSCSSGREGFLSASELSGFVERLIAGVDTRVARIGAFRPGSDLANVDPVIEDLTWCANVLSELDVTLTLNPLSVWGKSVRDARVSLSGQLSAFLRAADRAVDKALPLERVPIAGRMTRKSPQLTAPVQGETVQAVRHLLKLVGAVRGPASIFGAESDRKTLVESLTDRLTDYADQALLAVNDGEAKDEVNALRLVELAARCLDLIDARDAARTVRRRAAVAGAGKGGSKPSSRAA
ncbi:MAG: hypothetical protein QME55_10785 [Brevundimonas sp.]|uniref:hypothetical protein n=1 Tax=Brevundimonas sp. TaxID=1871086 RepID=UPI002608DF52|nr:hypothetical protein [Brevundimonas sp.]MDI6625203.1 hypothetical protein [Brevundimonas sp.]MDQ7812955.1 hypothetical protein [Brevundimonas sp.]